MIFYSYFVSIISLNFLLNRVVMIWQLNKRLLRAQLLMR
ncbi:hypothetical protein NI35_4179 [Salmonella enterica subsp. enterica serovar Cerro]|uniref:Uncharacterized protein n=2 Tax=Salmonella enterica I TaxID=59201 RepID=A0A6C6Z6T1_SALPB|nr:hypothetical protein SPAB_04315 [Salmonella enterica subsp. enterica serovar Paratyphi B str. SPB7]EDZ04033.1 conserved hypothetical protein [Salmonella enterica subsp. enterica serovar Virchow str. SL491]KMN28326.1 hypothetical protein NI35_4179 [Salmonella enterica subsp. enterica serovar Cerro]QDX89804.1 hypothetical protein FORC93_3756 [Salmonella enterica subsp. enterica serovar Braenderup]